VIVLDPEIAKAFPNDEAVNDALRGLISPARSSVRARSPRKTKKATVKRRAA